MGVFLDVLVRVEFHLGEAAVSLVSMGELANDIRPPRCMFMPQRNYRTQVYGAIRLVTLVNVLTNLLQTNLRKAIGCQVFDYYNGPCCSGFHACSPALRE